MVRAALTALLLLLPTAAAAADFDLASWALSLDPDEPASGDWVLYDGGTPIPEEVVATLRDSLYAEDPLLPRVAVEELSAYGVPAGESLLLELARSVRWSALDEDLQTELVVALRLMRSGRALPVLARIAIEGEGPAAEAAIRALCESAAPEAEPVLRAVIADGDRRKQALVIRWLRKAGEREASREARHARRTERRDDRTERREDRREGRTERKEERKERRTERKEERQERKEDRKAE